MKVIGNTYKHKEEGFKLEVTTCNKKLVTTKNVESGETTKFNRGKFEWMVSKGVFELVSE